MEALEELKQRKESLLAKLRAVTNGVVGNAPEEDLCMILQALHEAVAHELGFVDALACLAGADKESREESLVEGMRDGRVECLERHEVACPGCEAATQLWSELNPN